MWQFLQILFFGGTVLITPMPVDTADSWLEIHLKEPVEAVNSGATLQVDVTSIVPPTQPGGHDVWDRLARAKDRFPKGCVEARLVTKEQREIILTNVSPSISSTQTFLLLTNAAGMPTDIKFSNIFVRASCPISATHVYWHNFSE